MGDWTTQISLRLLRKLDFRRAGFAGFCSRLGWRRECQSIPTETKKHFRPFLDQNPPFELQPKAGVSPPIFHGIIVALASFSRLHRRCNWECRGSNTTPTLAGIEQPLIVQQTRGLGKIVRAGTHSVTHVIFDPVVAVVRFQKRAQGRVYSSISPEPRRDHRARTTWRIRSACSAKVCSGRSKGPCAKLEGRDQPRVCS